MVYSLDLPANRKLGSLCFRGHRYNGLEQSLRDMQNNCIECSRLKANRYYRNNKGKCQKAVAAWKGKNPDKVRQYLKTSYKRRKLGAIAQIEQIAEIARS